MNAQTRIHVIFTIEVLKVLFRYIGVKNLYLLLCGLVLVGSCGPSDFAKDVAQAVQKQDDQEAEDDALVVDNLYSPREYDNTELAVERERVLEEKPIVVAEKKAAVIAKLAPLPYNAKAEDCTRIPVNIRHLFYSVAQTLVKGVKDEDLPPILNRIAKLMGLAKPESSWIVSNITIHAKTRKGHLENKSTHLQKVKDAQGAVSYLAAFKDVVNGFNDERLSKRINRTTNFGLLQVSPDQFVRSYVKDVFGEMLAQAPTTADTKTRVESLQNWCHSARAYHDLEEHYDVFAQMIADLDTHKWNARKISREPKLAGTLLNACPIFNIRMGYIIAQTSGFNDLNDSKSLVYYGTRRHAAECMAELKTNLGR